MNKKLIRLTEQDLHRIVKESVNRILRESIDPWEDAVYKHYTRERLPKGWERIDREDDEPIYRDPDFNEYVKDEYGNFRLIENSNHILTIKDTEETPFTRNKQNYKPRRIKGAFSQSYNTDNPSVLAKQMMHDRADFYDFVIWCKRRGLDPREYIDTTDFETLMWIDPDADDLDKININDYI